MAYQYSQSFQGGLQALPAGYMEAATQPGRAIAAGIASFGDSMGRALERYGQRREESAFYDQKIQDIAGVISSIPQSSDPKTPEGQMTQHIMRLTGAKDQEGLHDWFSKAPEMSLGKRKALAADMSFLLDRYDTAKKNEFGQQLQQAQINQYKQQQIDNRAVADAYGYVNDPKNLSKTVPGGYFTEKIPEGLDPAMVKPGEQFYVDGPDQVGAKSYDELYQDLNARMIQAGASPAALEHAGKVLEAAGFQKALRVQEQKLSSGATVVKADGKIEVIPPPKAAEGKPLTEYQSKAITFIRGMEGNSKTVDSIINKGYKTGMTDKFIPENWKGEDRKIYEASKNAWIENFLRHRSGAAINKDEYDAIDKQYFPQPGDGVDVSKLKTDMRKNALDSMRAPLAQQVGGDYFQKPSGGVWNPMSKKWE